MLASEIVGATVVLEDDHIAQVFGVEGDLYQVCKLVNGSFEKIVHDVPLSEIREVLNDAEKLGRMFDR